MKWMKWGLGAAGALIAGAVFAFGVLAVSGTAQASDDEPARVSRFQELLAQQLGVSVDRLKAAETSARDQLLAELVTAGTITQAQADKIKSSEIGGMLRAMGSRGHGGPRGHMMKVAVNAVKVTADVSKVTVEAVRADLEQGKSLAQIAAAHGVSREGLKVAITNSQKTALQNAVSSGKMTQAQADRAAQELAERIDSLIDRTGFGGMKGPHGPRPGSTQ